MYFIVQYDRGMGKLISITEYGDDSREQAQSERLKIEIIHYRERREMETVLLHAADLRDLETTHGRYFKDVKSLALLASGKE